MEKYNAVEKLKKILTFTDILNNYSEKDKEYIIKLNCERLYNLFRGLSQDPNDYFDCVGTGCFKQAYKLVGADDVIIKFCCEDNNTEAEKSSLDCAFDNELEQFFVPTYFIKLEENEGNICLYDIEGDDCAYYEEEYINSDGEVSYRDVPNENFEYPRVAWIEIQKKCISCENADEDELFYLPSLNEKEKNKYQSIKLGNYIIQTYKEASDFRKLIASKTWWNNAVKNYGIEDCKKLISFAEKHNLYDLHKANIGYCNGKAVIFDWMSN